MELIAPLIVIPILTVLATPFILIFSLFGPGKYWSKLKKNYKRFINALLQGI